MGIISYIKHQIRHEAVTRQMLSDIITQITNISIDSKIAFYQERTMNCEDPGICRDVYNGEEIIVSLTTFGHRILDVYLAIESIMQGTIKPNRIILWLSDEEFYDKALPITLQKQKLRGLDIRYCEDLLSYKKIIPTLLAYPDAVVVTIDDDAMYEFDFLERLIETHITNPLDICACRLHRITKDNNGHINSYLKWDMEIDKYEKTNLNFLTSGGGALFPAQCFCDTFFDKELFMSLCPHADDVWINAMIWLSGKQISKVYTHSRRGRDYTDISLCVENALSLKNNDPNHCENDIQIKALFDHFDLYRYLQ